MPETTPSPRPDSPLTALRRRWPVAALAALLGALAGVGAATKAPATYTAEARLAVAPDSNSAYAIAGFPTAARDLAANYSRWVQNNAASGAWAADKVTSITASPIPESGVIRIETQSTDEQAAIAGATKISQQLQKVVSEAQVNQDPKVAYQRYAELAPKVAAAQTALDAAQSAYGRAPSTTTSAAVEKARTDLSLIQLERDAQADLYRRLTSDTSGISQLKEIDPAASTGDDRKSKMQLYGLLGLALGLGLALIVLALLSRRRPRPADPADTGRIAPTAAGAIPPAEGASVAGPPHGGGSRDPVAPRSGTGSSTAP